MIELFNTAVRSPVIITLTVLYFLTSSITTFDIRMTQGKCDGTIPSNEQMPPRWVALIYWIDWLLIIAIFLLNWKYAVLVFIVKFILQVLPVLEIAGNILMSPFKRKG